MDDNVYWDGAIFRDRDFSQILERCQPRREIYPGSRPPSQIKKLPTQLRAVIMKEEKTGDRVYDPMVVSLGPYHHGKPELSTAEELKYTFLDQFTMGHDEMKHWLYGRVLQKIKEIRACYADKIYLDKYNDKALAAMMLLDGCFIVAFIERVTGVLFDKAFLEWENCSGVATLRLAIRDMMVLENQIPFFVIKLLIRFRHEKEQDVDELLCKFMNWFLYGESKCSNCTTAHKLCGATKNGGEESVPLHLLEACRRMLVGKHASNAEAECISINSSNNENEKINTEQDLMRTAWKTPRFDVPNSPDQHSAKYLSSRSSVTSTYRSVMDLKAKGIHFRRSSSSVYRDVGFKSRSIYGELLLPGQTVSSNTRVILSNMIAYEVTSGSITEYEVLSHVNFMKSLIQSPIDVKELQEKGILFNRFHNREQVVQEFRAIETFGIDNIDIYRDIKWEIEEHSRSKAKTWLADLIHTRFSSPWTAIALLAGVFLLCLTFLQTYFTINPAKSK